MFALTEQKSRIVEKPNALPLVVTPAQSYISFRNITFGYVPNKPPILNGLSFDVPSGKKVALVGGSGSGKSTIIRLLYRLYNPESGQIFINNQAIEAVTLNSLRRAIAIVPQDSVLFHDTIYYNIHYGNVQATEEQVYYMKML
jgi:ATP-binding cassette subfamily B (MDR/TAP) protein 7